MYRMLIVDDEHAVTDSLYQLFIRDREYNLDIHKAYKPLEALEIAKQMRIDILISDISMPGMNGIDMYKELLQIWRHCKAVFLTGYDDFNYIQRVMRLGGIDYVTKTESDEVLWKAVKKSIRLLKEEGVPSISKNGDEADTSFDCESKIVAKLNSYIENNILNDLSVAKISKDLFYNPSYVSRIYKQVTGKKLSDLIWEMKISKAIELLQDDENKIYDIARKLGFDSPAYFAKFFKKHMGVNPQEYKDSLKK